MGMVSMNSLSYSVSKVARKCLQESKHVKVRNAVFTRGRSFNFGFWKGRAYLKEALIKYIKKTLKYFQLVSLIKQ